MNTDILIGAIAGDIIGSYYEFVPIKSIDFPLFNGSSSHFTDDTIMTIANADWLLTGDSLLGIMQDYGNRYHSSYGSMFYEWLRADNPQPYNSWGNGSAMRVSPIGWAFNTLEETLEAAKLSAEVTHNHPEGIKGAVVTAVCIWMARHGKTKEDIFQYVLEQYPAEKYEYSIAVPLDKLEKIYQWNETCMGSVPAAMRCFYESDSYESFLRNVFRLKCDSDILAAIGGAVAEEYYGWTGFYNEDELLKKYLDANLYNLVKL